MLLAVPWHDWVVTAPTRSTSEFPKKLRFWSLTSGRPFLSWGDPSLSSMSSPPSFTPGFSPAIPSLKVPATILFMNCSPCTFSCSRWCCQPLPARPAAIPLLPLVRSFSRDLSAESSNAPAESPSAEEILRDRIRAERFFFLPDFELTYFSNAVSGTVP